jgi:hypothetical protein
LLGWSAATAELALSAVTNSAMLVHSFNENFIV